MEIYITWKQIQTYLFPIMNKIESMRNKESEIILAMKDCRKQAFWFKFTGWLCIPWCCLGSICLVAGYSPDEFAAKFAEVISLYGGRDSVRVLAERVHKEITIFRTAVTEVNYSVDPTEIRANIDLFDVICDHNPRINALRSNKYILSNHNKNYSHLVWNAYMKHGGNYSVIVYGIIEYMCIKYEPTSSLVEVYLNNVTNHTSLRVEVLAHKQYL